MYVFKFHRLDNGNKFYVPANKVDSYSVTAEGIVTLSVNQHNVAVRESITDIHHKHIVANTYPCFRRLVKWILKVTNDETT